MEKIFQKENLWRCLEYLEEYFNGSTFHVSMKVSEDETITYLVNGQNTQISFSFCMIEKDIVVLTLSNGLKVNKSILSDGNFVNDLNVIFNGVSKLDKDFFSFVRIKKINNIKSKGL